MQTAFYWPLLDLKWKRTSVTYARLSKRACYWLWFQLTKSYTCICSCMMYTTMYMKITRCILIWFCDMLKLRANWSSLQLVVPIKWPETFNQSNGLKLWINQMAWNFKSIKWPETLKLIKTFGFDIPLWILFSVYTFLPPGVQFFALLPS